MMLFSRHPMVVFIGILTGVILSGGLNNLFQSFGNLRFLDRTNHIIESRPFLLFITFSFGTFLLWAYVFPGAYYYPRDVGATGDSYLYMSAAMRDSSYYNPQHIFYPWIPGQSIRLTRLLGVLSTQDSSYLEKAFWVSSIPTRVFIILAFLSFIWALRVGGCHLSDAVLGTFLMATSAGCWLWGRQSNALGLGLAMEIISSAAFIFWRRHLRLSELVFVGFSLAACVYAHIATIYFVIGGYLCVLFLLLQEVRLKPKIIFWNFCAFNGVILCMAAIFYYMSGRYVGSFDSTTIFHRLADTNYLGEFGFRFNLIPRLAKENLVRGIMNLIYWDRKTPFDRFLITTQVVLLSSLGFSLFWKFNKVLHQLFRSEFLFFTLTSLATFLGFLYRNSGSHYYVVATVPYVGLFALLLLHPESPVADVLQRRILLIFFIGSMILYSGFSTWNVFKGGDLEENDCYRISRTISTIAPSGQHVVYYGRFESDYQDGAIQNYYKAKFAYIDWKSNPLKWADPEKLMENLMGYFQEGKKVFLSREVLGVLQSSSRTVVARHFTDEVNLLAPKESR
jgi:hypothetical protein